MLHGLRVARYRFALQSLSRIELNHLIGSTLRGASGGVFRRLVCVTHMPVCDGCLLRHQCAYGYLFETAPPADSAKLRNYQDIPRPFVLEPPAEDKTMYAPGESLAFNLVLIGRALDYLPYFIFVFRELEQHGLGRGRKAGQGQFRLHQVTACLPDSAEAVVYDRSRDLLTDTDARLTAHHLHARVTALQQTTDDTSRTSTSGHEITIHFLAPTRIKFEGHLLKDFQFHHLIRALLRRLSGLLYFHCGSELDVDFRGLIQKAQEIKKVNDALDWQEQTRYSARQKTEMHMGGFVGTATFAGDLTPFLSLLAAGEWVHVGKGCVMGLGKYQIITS